MLEDGKLDSLDTRLEQFKLNNGANQIELQGILKEYTQLLDDYRILKGAFERNNKGPYGRGRESAYEARNPYVLVLIDGNGYTFNDELIREKEEGGMRAARMLNDAVEKYIRESLPQARNARVIVRIYADLTNLSKQLARGGLIGMDKRSLAPFTAAFTRAISLFDFVDALDEEGTRFKIRETFKIAAEDSACSHILYAACHDSSYLPQLVPYSGIRNKITLVQGAAFNSEFHQFSLNVTQFPTIFRWSALSTMVPSTKSSSINHFPLKPKISTKQAPTPSTFRHENAWNINELGGQSTYMTDDMSPVGTFDSADHEWDAKSEWAKKPKPCKYFQKGFCRFGNKCSFQHVPNGLVPSEEISNGNTTDRSNLSSQLPSAVIEGFIALNKDGQRLDAYRKPPSQEEWAMYNARFQRQKPCNSHYLQGRCTRFGCPFDHSTLDPESMYCLQYVLKCSPCPKRGACRASDCYFGHICPKNDCKGRTKGCKMTREQHDMDPKLASMIPAEDNETMYENHSGNSADAPFLW